MKQQQIELIPGEVRVKVKQTWYRIQVAKLQVLKDGSWTTVSVRRFPIDIRANAIEAMRFNAEKLGIIPATA